MRTGAADARGDFTFTTGVIPQTNWSLRFVDSQELVGENDAAVNSFDGNPNTLWHTQWFNASPPPPHEIQINLSATYSLTGFLYRHGDGIDLRHHLGFLRRGHPDGLTDRETSKAALTVTP